MDNETQFIESIWVKKGKYDFVVANLNVNAKGLVEFFKKNAEYIKDNNGYINIELLKTRNDRDKYYAKFTPFTPKPKVEASEHMPDRQMADKEPAVEVKETEDDLPF